ncbi:MAG: GNAT family N-acetyltransferase [Candidatus Odinarchaeota archaeon]
MIREIQSNEFSIVEHLIDSFIERMNQDKEMSSQWKDGILRAVELGIITPIASFNDQNEPIGFAIFRSLEGEITATHPLDADWKTWFNDIFHHLRARHSVIRIRGGAVPESMHDRMIEFGFRRIDLAQMSIRRADIDSLHNAALPENFSIVLYTEEMKDTVAQMLFESYVGTSFEHHFPDQIGSVETCKLTLERMNKDEHLFLLMENDIPIGSCLIVVHGCHGNVGLVAILPEYRKRGLGRIIVVEALVDAVKENSEIESIFLEVGHGDSAFRLYESIGFITNSIQPLFAWSEKG